VGSAHAPIGFWNHLILLLTPLSKESVRAGFEDSLLLPKLSSITLGDDDYPSNSTPIDALDLASNAASRKAINGLLSTSQVMLAATGGDLESCDSPASNGTTAFPGSCVKTSNLTVNPPLQVDEKTLEWLENNVLGFNHRVLRY